MAVFTPKKGRKKKKWHSVPPSRHLRRFLRKPLNRSRQAITVLHFPPVYFYLQQLIQLFPVVTYLSRACFRAISIQRVYKVTALMGFRKEVVFLRASVGGGSEASCLSSFNWFSVAIGAGAFFSPFPSHESAALQSQLPGFRSTRRCQGSCPGFYTNHRLH